MHADEAYKHLTSKLRVLWGGGGYRPALTGLGSSHSPVLPTAPRLRAELGCSHLPVHPTAPRLRAELGYLHVPEPPAAPRQVFSAGRAIGARALSAPPDEEVRKYRVYTFAPRRVGRMLLRCFPPPRRVAPLRLQPPRVGCQRGVGYRRSRRRRSRYLGYLRDRFRVAGHPYHPGGRSGEVVGAR